MPFRVRDSSTERRREKKDAARPARTDRERKDKDRDRRRSRRKTTTKEMTSSSTSLSPDDHERRSSMPAKLDGGAPVKPEPRPTLPYPSFSKEHSRESVGGAARPALNIFTPPTTDVNASKERLPPSKGHAVAHHQHPPPSPPLTDHNAGSGRWKVNAGKHVVVETIPEEDKDKAPREAETPKSRPGNRLDPKSVRSNGHLRSPSDSSPAGTPTRAARDSPVAHTKPSTPRQTTLPQRSVSQPTRLASPATPTASTADSATRLSSEATSIAPEQPDVQRPGSKIPPAAPFADVPHLPTVSPATYPDRLHPSPVDVIVDTGSSFVSVSPGDVSATSGPPPPPPAPMPVAVPKVDYLLQFGGLNHTIPKNLLLAGKPMAVQQAQSPMQPSILVANLFEPYTSLLEDFEKIMAKNGSLAVATGYRSVARRLLDRLEAVFARDISSEACRCPLCQDDHADDVRGVSWGEVLELVSGRKDLPLWPPFTFTQSPVGLGISLEVHVPMQKLDIDVPDEYREHYIRQSRKTKQSVDKWLNRQNDTTTSPPEEVDDETLTFAILTHLPVDQRASFKNLLGIVDRPIEPPRRIATPEPRPHSVNDPRSQPPPGSTAAPAPTPTPAAAPTPRSRPEHIAIAAQAIRRLYRLAFLPRDAECALFLLNNPTLHHALATLAAISNDEWDILISGRFDGFLRSGAEDGPAVAAPSAPEGPHPSSRGSTPHRPPTRGATPGGPTRSRQGSYTHGPAPASAQYGAPIAFDEETELATLAEIERDVYAGMEALEDAFESLHNKAELVRRALRERSAGLAAAAQRRRGTLASGVEIRMDTPASGCAPFTDGPPSGRWDVDADDGLGEWDGLSEIQPDDSASNISSARRRRPKRRNERRTPALIEEEDEFDEGLSEGTGSPRKR